MSGQVTIELQRLQRLSINKNERNKLLKELYMAGVLAKHNGIPADFKRTSSHNNIKKYASNAIKRQHARIIVFQLDKENPAIHKELLDLVNRAYSIIYFFSTHPDDLYSFL